MSPISGQVRISYLYVISKVQIMNLKSGQCRGFRWPMDRGGPSRFREGGEGGVLVGFVEVSNL